MLSVAAAVAPAVTAALLIAKQPLVLSEVLVEVSEKLTVPAYEFTETTLTVEVPEFPWVTVTFVAESVKDPEVPPPPPPPPEPPVHAFIRLLKSTEPRPVASS